LWIREAELVQRLIDRRDNPLYLPGVRFPGGVRPHDDLAQAVKGADLVVAAVPSLFARQVYRELNASLTQGTPIVVAAKGIEAETLALPLEVAREELASAGPLAILSGPSFATEVARGIPTAIVVASEDDALACRVQAALSDGNLRLYTNQDPLGVQLAGALKNVIAIAVGVADGLGMGANVLAALITRGLAEISRLGREMGAQSSTFSGLAGLGDLVLTCTGDLSRNRGVGQRLGRGERLEDILESRRSVAEGVRTTLSAWTLAQRHRVQMPIVEEAHRILYLDGSPQQSLERLMTRPLTREHDPTRE
jgi:glycerol-3-phosphate dehydrogenase (NAD(P)+)